ncbi:MAG: hypothetical protein WDZ76_01785 [Pseudohongiellaceae bacterium]
MSNESDSEYGFWQKFRRLLVFQVKLYIDAFRDLVMSPVSVVAFLLDLIQGKSGEDSNFEGALRFGRRTEKTINLFGQYSNQNEGRYDVDAAVQQLEENISRQYREGGLSEKTKQALEKTLSVFRR